MYHLRSSKQIQGAGGSNHNKHEAVVTVVILTVIFLVVTIPHFVQLIFQLICHLSSEKVCWKFPTPFLHHLFCFYIPTLNSACNPLVYLLRIKKLRTYSVQILTCGTKRDGVRPSEHDSKVALDANIVRLPFRVPARHGSPCRNVPAICRVNEVPIP